jgi:hypothetical protein
MKTMTIEVNRDNEWVQVQPEELTTPELCEILSMLTLDSDEFIPQKEIDEGYAAINEAIRRLSNDS